MSGKLISRSVWILSLVSMCTDMASEMLYPVMPVFLKSIGFSVLFIGILEGIAESVAGISKGYFGKLSDTKGRRLPFVQLGYGLSALSKPMLAFFIQPLWIFASRTIDRLGKGIRTGARDAMLSDETDAANKGRVFGFHRSWDTAGAMLGPLFALIYLYYKPNAYRDLFLWAFIPGAIAIILTFLIKEKNKTEVTNRVKIHFWSFLKYWKKSPHSFKMLTIGLLLFTLANSSDVFLILKMKESGLSDTTTLSIYIFYNLIYALCAYPLGILADKIGFRRIFILGLICFVAVYLGFGMFSGLRVFVLLFIIYALYAAATEGVSKAWITNVVQQKDTATAIGFYTSFQSLITLFASSFAGFLWMQFKAEYLFLFSGALTVGVILYFIFIPQLWAHNDPI